MKAKITLLTDDKNPISTYTYGNNPEESIKEAWELFLTIINAQRKIHVVVDSVEILND